MCSREHVLELSRTLMKAKNKSDADKVLSILETLNNVDMNISLLKESELGKKVNSIRKSESFKNARGIKETAQSLITKWKQLVQAESRAKKSKNGKKNSNHKKLKLKNKSPSLTPQDILNDNTKNTSNTINPDGFIRDSVSWETGDNRRDKMISKFIAVLKPNPDKAQYLCYIKIATEIEDALATAYELNTEAYIAKYRDLHFNLKRNTDLKFELLCGRINVSKLVTMKSEEMANKSLRDKRDKEKKWAMEEARSDHCLDVSQAMTDEYKCGKCKQRKCKYSQAQTRSADEPMTTFVSCLVCGNHWKF